MKSLRAARQLDAALHFAAACQWPGRHLAACGGGPMARQALGRLWRRANGQAGTWPLVAAGQWLGRHLAASRSSTCYRDHRDHRDRACLALRTRNRLTGTTRILRVALTAHCRSTQRARRPLSQWLRTSQWLARKPPLPPSRRSRPAHQKMKSLRAARPPPVAIPRHRSATHLPKISSKKLKSPLLHLAP